MLNERQRQILQIIADKKSIKSSYLVETLGVSDETVRRDLQILEKQALIKRIFGGAVFHSARNMEADVASRHMQNYLQKRNVGVAVAELVRQGDSIAISGGTTTQEIALSLQRINNLTVLTNSFTIADTIIENPTAKVYIAGGEYSKRRSVTMGISTCEYFSNFRVDKSIICSAGVTLEAGVTDYSENACSIMQHMIRIAAVTILAVDYTKIGMVTLRKICDLDSIDYIVTNSNAPQALISDIESAGVKVKLAPALSE